MFLQVIVFNTLLFLLFSNILTRTFMNTEFNDNLTFMVVVRTITVCSYFLREKMMFLKEPKRKELK